MKSSMCRHGSPRNARGFSLLEVLIALLVLAFGLLGFALLQTMNLRFTQSANHRTQATNLAYDLLDQIRANRLQAPEYTAITPGTFAGEDGKDCTPAAVAAVTDNIARWRCQVVSMLGSGANATVNYTPADGMVSVRVTWNDERWAVDPLDQNKFFELRTQL